MTRSKLTSIALVLATMAVATASAQTPPPAGASPGAKPQAGAQSGPPGGASPQEGPGNQYGGQPAEGPPYPVAMVTSVEVLRSEKSGGMDIVRARGVVTSQAWGTPHLVPITQGQSVDGVLDVLFLATAPQAPEGLGNFMTVEALLPINHGHPYKAVRVRSATNAIALKSLPGFAEVPAPKHDCSKCLGRYFVAKGAQPPAGVPEDNIVRQENLPWELRVIGPTQGIPSYSVDPNRLTLVLSEDGRIVDAAWD